VKNYKLPGGFTALKRGGAILMLNDGYKDILAGEGVGNPEEMIRKEGAGIRVLEGGRGRVVSVALRGMPGDRMVVRKYEHGGIFAKVLGDVFAGPLSRSRPLKELRVSALAAQKGLPVPEIIGVWVERHAGFFWRGYIYSREIPDAENLTVYLGRKERKEKGGVIRAVALVLRKLHGQKIYHGDLNAANILVQEKRDGIKVFLIDMDKSKIISGFREKNGIRNLIRFSRSVDKMRLPVSGSDRRLFMRAYFGPSLPEKKVLKKCLRSYHLHSLGRRFADE